MKEGFRSCTTEAINITRIRSEEPWELDIEDAYMMVECRTVDAVFTTHGHTLTTRSGDIFRTFIPDDKNQVFVRKTDSTTQASSNVEVKLIPWILTTDSTGGHLITMVVALAQPRQEDDDYPALLFEKEREHAYERIGMFRIVQGGEGNETLDSFPAYHNGVPETITLV